jgi:hypothetical protein
MKTIEEVLAEYTTGDATVPEGLAAALVEREQEAVDRLQLFAQRFGLLPAVVTRVILELGLGEQPDEETRAMIEAQYQELLEQAKRQHEAAFAAMRALGVPVPEHEYIDPLSVSIDVEVPDSPPES